jgi:hypothetical protein
MATIVTVTILLLAACNVATLQAKQLRDTWAQPQTMKNIGYLALGYNIFKGDPKNTRGGSDPGFVTTPIFEFTYNSERYTAD